MSDSPARDPMLKWLAVGMFGMMFFMVLIMAGGGIGLYFALNRQPVPAPSPSPSTALSTVVVGEFAKPDSAVYEAYFTALAEVIEKDSGEIKQREQASRLIKLSAKIGKRFIKGEYPDLYLAIGNRFKKWEDSAEFSAADRIEMAAMCRQVASEFHSIHE